MLVIKVEELRQKVNKLKDLKLSNRMDIFVEDGVAVNKTYDYAIMWNLDKLITLENNPLKNLLKIQKSLNEGVREGYEHSSKVVHANTLMDLDDFINQLEHIEYELKTVDFLWFKHSGMDKVGIILFYYDAEMMLVYNGVWK